MSLSTPELHTLKFSNNNPRLPYLPRVLNAAQQAMSWRNGQKTRNPTTRYRTPAGLVPLINAGAVSALLQVSRSSRLVDATSPGQNYSSIPSTNTSARQYRPSSIHYAPDLQGNVPDISPLPPSTHPNQLISETIRSPRVPTACTVDVPRPTPA